VVRSWGWQVPWFRSGGHALLDIPLFPTVTIYSQRPFGEHGNNQRWKSFPTVIGELSGMVPTTDGITKFPMVKT
jgi:hypothetical protein